jgi:hypothetical protein
MRDTGFSDDILALASEWDAEAKAGFRKRPVVVRHNYHEHPAFSDQALAELIERHPRDLSDYCTMGEDPTDRESWRAGERGRLTGEQCLEAVRNGRLWINLRHAMDRDPFYRPIYDAMIADMKRENPGFQPLNAEAGILISSPSAQVFLHSDVSETMLWHMRGVKRFRVYPPAFPYFSERLMEAILHLEQTEDVPYDPDWDDAAFTVDLEPGMAANWPLYGPHRIENQSGLNVSVPFEIVTRESMLQNNVLYANRVLRRFGFEPGSSRTDGPGALAKLALAKAHKMMSKLTPAKPMPKSETTFEMDPLAEGGFSERASA